MDEFTTSDEPYYAEEQHSLSKPGDKAIFSAAWILAILFPFIGISLSAYGLQLEKAKKNAYKKYFGPLIVSAILSAAILVFLFFIMFTYFINQ